MRHHGFQHARAIGIINVQDVIAPSRYRRVYQSINMRQNSLYYGSTFLRFSTHGLIAEELGARGPRAPSGGVIPSRNVTTRTTPTSNIRGYQNSRNTPPPVIAREEIPAVNIPTNSVLGSRFDDIGTATSTVGDAVDLDGINEELWQEDTDTALQDIIELVRPRSWTRHTVLNIRFKYPLMEAFGSTPDGMMNTVPYAEISPTGAYFDELERLAALQNTYTDFNLFANSHHVIEIPYPVGNQLPVHFDIMNHNGLYSANVNLSVTALIRRQDD